MDVLVSALARPAHLPHGWAKWVFLGVLFTLATGCDGLTGPSPDRVPDLLVHSWQNDHPVIQGVRLADGKVLFSLRAGTEGLHATWSPDGEFITYVKQIGYDPTSGVSFTGPLVLATAMGRRLGVLSEIGGDHSWSPDGTRIAVSYRETDHYYDRHSLHVVDTETGASWLVAGGEHSRAGPSWSPDSKQFAACWRTCIVNADGSGYVTLEAGGKGSVWSPDGSTIAFWREVEHHWDTAPVFRSEIFLISPGGGEPTQLTDTSTPDAYSMESVSPAWSPDGSTIAFVRQIKPLGHGSRPYSHLYVMNADGSNSRRISAGEYAEAPAWSPDGRVIAYVGRGGVRIVSSDGSGDHLLVAGGAPVWRPVRD